MINLSRKLPLALALAHTDDTERALSPADAAMQGESPAEESATQDEPKTTDEPEWRADAEAALNERDA